MADLAIAGRRHLDRRPIPGDSGLLARASAAAPARSVRRARRNRRVRRPHDRPAARPERNVGHVVDPPDRPATRLLRRPSATWPSPACWPTAPTASSRSSRPSGRRYGGGHDGRPHDGTARSAIVPFPDQSAYLSTLLDDPRIHDIAASLLGDDFNYTSGDGNFYVGDTPLALRRLRRPRLLSIKIAFYLDPVTRTTGCLRVIPGSHRVGEPWCGPVGARRPPEPGGVGHPRRRGAGGARWRARRATWWSSTTTSSTPPSAARSGGACSP